MYKTLIADDHPLFREAIRDVIADGFPGSEAMETADLDSILDPTQEHDDLNLILLDLNVPGMHGLSDLMNLCNEAPTIPVVIVSAEQDKQVVLQAITYSAVDFITKSSPRVQITEAIKQILNGNVYLPSNVICTQKSSPRCSGHEEHGISPELLQALIHKQLLVLERMTKGESNKQIACNLNIAETTVRAHVSAILRKPRAYNRVQAILSTDDINFAAYLRRRDPPMSDRRTLLLTVLAMLALVGNSPFCRAALKDTVISAVSPTAPRLFSGALVFTVLLHLRWRPATPARGGWREAVTLFVYAAVFSYAYVQLDAGTGALPLSGVVQVTLLLVGLLRGERLGGQALLDFLLALGGLLFLLLPGTSVLPLGGALLMPLSGLAWGLYTLLGRDGGDLLAVGAGNFLRAPVFTALLLLAFHGQLRPDGTGLAYALLPGALAPGFGYAVWYSALPGLTVIQGVSAQFSAPALAALSGVLLLGEPPAPRLPPVTLAVLGGIALILAPRLGRAARKGA